MEGSLPSFQRCNPSLPVALKFYLLLGVVSGLDYYLSFAKDIAFFSGKARIRITILNDSLISETRKVFTICYRESVSPCGHQALSVD